jgi:hypothetical protein
VLVTSVVRVWGGSGLCITTTGNVADIVCVKFEDNGWRGVQPAL